MKKLVVIIFFLIAAFNALAINRYWVGGTGNWGNTARWSASSGGATGASVPTVSDDVFFDANSFTAAGQTVTVNGAGYRNCKSMNWTGSKFNPTFAKAAASSGLNVNGNITFMTFDVSINCTLSKFCAFIPIEFIIII